MRTHLCGALALYFLATCKGQTWKGKEKKKKASTAQKQTTSKPTPARKKTATASTPAKKPAATSTSPKPTRVTASDKAKASAVPPSMARSTDSTVSETIKRAAKAKAQVGVKKAKTKVEVGAKTKDVLVHKETAERTAGGKKLTLADQIDVRSSPSKAKVLYLTDKCSGQLCSGKVLSPGEVLHAQGSFMSVSDVDVQYKNPEWSLAEIKAVQTGIWPANHAMKMCYVKECPTQHEIDLAVEKETDPIMVATKYKKIDLARIRKAMHKNAHDEHQKQGTTNGEGKKVPAKKTVKTVKWDSEEL